MATATRAFTPVEIEEALSRANAAGQSYVTGFTKVYKQFWREGTPKFTSIPQVLFIIGILDETVSSKVDSDGNRRGGGNPNPGPEWSAHHPDQWWSDALGVPLRTFQWLKADALQRGLIEKMPGGKRGSGLRYRHTYELLAAAEIPSPGDFAEPPQNSSQSSGESGDSGFSVSEEEAKQSRNGLRLQHTFAFPVSGGSEPYEIAPHVTSVVINNTQFQDVQLEVHVDPTVTDHTHLVWILSNAKKDAEQTQDTTDPNEADRELVRNFYVEEADLPLPTDTWLNETILKPAHENEVPIPTLLVHARRRLSAFTRPGLLKEILGDVIAAHRQKKKNQQQRTLLQPPKLTRPQRIEALLNVIEALNDREYPPSSAQRNGLQQELDNADPGELQEARRLYLGKT